MQNTLKNLKKSPEPRSWKDWVKEFNSNSLHGGSDDLLAVSAQPSTPGSEEDN